MARKPARPTPSHADAAEAEAPAPAGDLEDAPEDPAAIDAAPPRNHESLVSQFALKWHEIKVFAAHLVGDIDGELGEVLSLARKYE